MGDIEARLKRLEQRAENFRDDEAEFYEYCTGPYDRSLTLEENLRTVEFPPGAVPSTAIGVPEGVSFSEFLDKRETTDERECTT